MAAVGAHQGVWRGSGGGRFYGSVGLRVYGSTGLWAYGSTGLRVYSSMGLWVYGSMGLWAYGSAATACFHHPQSIVLITYSMQPIPSVDASASDASATRRASTLCTAW
eukprot:4810649-Pyramimonas_sp.AAC.1